MTAPAVAAGSGLRSTGRSQRSIRRRRVRSALMTGVMSLAALLATLPLLFILFHLLRQGAASIDVDFFIHTRRPVGVAGGGMSNAIVGTLILVGLAAAVGLPIGIGAGLFLAEQRGAKLATLVRFLSDVLNGLPSIVMGIFAWLLFVRPVHHFSALSGGIALGAMMIPLVTRATEEMVRTVPVSLREAALALGYPRWRTSLAIVLRTALPGIVTAALVAIARIAGETAPLLFTAFGNDYFSVALDQPIHALPLQIYLYAISPYDEWHRLAWAGALVLIALVLAISLLARLVTGRRRGGVGD
jgi:phosphate transport system permease protein